MKISLRRTTILSHRTPTFGIHFDAKPLVECSCTVELYAYIRDIQNWNYRSLLYSYTSSRIFNNCCTIIDIVSLSAGTWTQQSSRMSQIFSCSPDSSYFSLERPKSDNKGLPSSAIKTFAYETDHENRSNERQTNSHPWCPRCYVVLMEILYGFRYTKDLTKS